MPETWGNISPSEIEKFSSKKEEEEYTEEEKAGFRKEDEARKKRIQEALERGDKTAPEGYLWGQEMWDQSLALKEKKKIEEIEKFVEKEAGLKKEEVYTEEEKAGFRKEEEARQQRIEEALKRGDKIAPKDDWLWGQEMWDRILALEEKTKGGIWGEKEAEVELGVWGDNLSEPMKDMLRERIKKQRKVEKK